MRSEGFGDPDRELDVREIEGAPFEPIMAELDVLPDGESLLLINGFEPEPLYDVLQDRGFEYQTANPVPGEWYVEVTRG